MKKTNKFTFSGILLLWFILLSPTVLGAAEQWFPTEGTTIDYKLKSVITWSNGTTQESSRYEIRNSSTNKYLIPMSIIDNEPDLPSHHNVLESNVEVTLTRTYSELSTTQLNRTSSVKGNTTLFDDHNGDIVIIVGKTGTSTIGRIFKLWNRAIDKSNFWDGDFSDFVDYFDKDTAIGEDLDLFCTAQAVTDNSIIGSDIDDSNIVNSTYVSERNGQVYFYQTIRSGTMVNTMGADYSAIIWVRVRNDSTIPSYNIGILITVMGSIVMIYCIKIWRSNKSSR